MTGFGAGTAPLAGGQVIAEVRSVNHRFVEVRTRVPPEAADQGHFLEQHVRQRLSRGRYDIAVRFDGAVPFGGFDVERARATFEELSRLRDELAPASELPVSALTSIPDLFTSRHKADVDALRAAITRAVDDALAALDEMRAAEGETLRAELEARLASMQSIHADMKDGVPVVQAQQAERVRERVSKLVAAAGAEVDEGRLETELAILADRSDVTEELVRLESHFAQLKSLFSSDKPVGRKMDFLLQEVGRETNTFGAKCSDAALSHRVVDLKAELERMREQVQNVE